MSGYRKSSPRSRRHFGGPALPPPEVCEPPPEPEVHLIRRSRRSMIACRTERFAHAATTDQSRVTCPRCLQAIGKVSHG